MDNIIIIIIIIITMTFVFHLAQLMLVESCSEDFQFFPAQFLGWTEARIYFFHGDVLPLASLLM